MSYEQRKEISRRHSEPDRDAIASYVAQGCSFKEAETVERLERRICCIEELKAEELATAEEELERRRLVSRLALLNGTTPARENEAVAWECRCGWSIIASPSPPDDGNVGPARCPECDAFTAKPTTITKPMSP
ncbi:MAG: hypothetical protein BRD55_01315 [Bacteroidetes bacterium SW_9_63_38]|nr:MAG: hypothetical protein BRD55_01315 [Bacteroidetes bacterium SW_9_63_38]